jgi:hypothetical protein
LAVDSKSDIGQPHMMIMMIMLRRSVTITGNNFSTAHYLKKILYNWLAENSTPDGGGWYEARLFPVLSFGSSHHPPADLYPDLGIFGFSLTKLDLM